MNSSSQAFLTLLLNNNSGILRFIIAPQFINNNLDQFEKKKIILKSYTTRSLHYGSITFLEMFPLGSVIYNLEFNSS